MGVGRIFSRGAAGGFPKFFPGGSKVVKFVFYPSKLKNNLFLLVNSKSRGAKAPPCPPLLTPMPADKADKNTLNYKSFIDIVAV